MNTISQVERTKLENMGLPKWPQMFVWGDSVTEEQAKSIIFRTDQYVAVNISMFSGNARMDEYDKWVMTALGYDKVIEQQSPFWPFITEIESEINKELQFIENEFVHNSWISSASINGPYGWCHPSGEIWYSDTIGSYPGADTVYDEWSKLAKAFPFIKLTVTLMSEGSINPDGVPVISFKVAEGMVQVLGAPIMPPDNLRRKRPGVLQAIENCRVTGYRNGISDAWIEEFGVKTREIIARIEPRIRERFQQL